MDALGWLVCDNSLPVSLPRLLKLQPHVLLSKPETKPAQLVSNLVALQAQLLIGLPNLHTYAGIINGA